MGMNPFESTLVAALHDEASEIAMSADLNEGRDVLDNRLDDVDRGRRRWQVVGGLVAAVAAVGVVAFLAVGRPTAAPQPGGPTPTASTSNPGSLTAPAVTTVAFEPTVSWEPPAWITAFSIRTSERTGHATWETSGECGDGCAGTGFVKVRSVKQYPSEQVIDVATPTRYLAYLRSLVAAGVLTVSDERSVTVGGLTGTAFTSDELRSVDDALGCVGEDGVSDCYRIDKGWTSQVVVLDDDGDTMVVVSSTRSDNPDRALYEAQFDAALASVRFTSS
jgi:hypothetical protein